jgi:hypothetical protein
VTARAAWLAASTLEAVGEHHHGFDHEPAPWM